MPIPLRRFQQHRANSKGRGIPFLLTFEQWLKIWTDSGQLENAGKHKGQYCMARLGDKGPYKVGNVRIISVEQNHRELRHTAENKEKARLRWLGRTHKESTKQKQSKGKMGPLNPMYGGNFSEEHRARMSESKLGNTNWINQTRKNGKYGTNANC
jgi:hypothetical protein